MESEFAGLSLDEEEEEEILQVQNDSDPVSEEEILSLLKGGEDPLRVPLITSPFWVQVHGVPIGFYSENLAMQLGNFIGNFQDYDGSSLGKENINFMRIRVQVDIQRPLKRKKQATMIPFVKLKWRLGLKLMNWDEICPCEHSPEEPKQ
ncbi:hypothetical protein Goklo_029199 [Gossypium klotzschianum]|uniref:DUF4283 domain-containing protein n=1 Tax=Gossypium klotzschianum TaxID=34286 RepID=A0A7J8W537_9ROSI|nr:hypothetical protein [Gossypium klotzschianum]